MDRIISTHSYEEIYKTITILVEQMYPIESLIQYRLIGTSAAILHGIKMPVNDIDILVKKRKDIDIINKAMSSTVCTCKPTWLVDSRQYFCSYKINNINVEFSTVEYEDNSDVKESLGKGPWMHYTQIECGKHCIPTVCLELRLLTELKRKRTDRYIPILEYFKSNGCDTNFLKRAFTELNIDTKVLEKYLNI